MFAIVHYNEFGRRFGPLPHAEPIPLSELSLLHSWSDIEEWHERVKRLRKGAYCVGDASLHDRASYDTLRAAYEAENPGFALSTYNEVISYGCFQAR